MKSSDGKRKVLFICTHNSARSQMAEGLLRTMYGDRYEAYSAGTKPTGVHPLAVRVMAEIGIDISHHRSKSVVEFLGAEFDYVVTVCDRAKESCPFFPGAREYIHVGFDDPAGFSGTEEESLSVFRRVRDEIKKWISETFGRARG
jgi:arsenate reductase